MNQPALAKLLEFKVVELELPVSTMLALEAHGIKTLGELASAPEPTLTALVGARRAQEIQEKLREVGLA